MIEPSIARSGFIVPALTRINLYSLDAERLLMGTAAIESAFRFFRQMAGGPAIGMFQMEPATYDWLYNGLLDAKRHWPLKALVTSLSTVKSTTADELANNHRFAAAMARIRYFVVKKPIPSEMAEQADYWWRYYNGISPHGRKPTDYLARWDVPCAALYRGRDDSGTGTTSNPPLLFPASSYGGLISV